MRQGHKKEIHLSCTVRAVLQSHKGVKIHQKCKTLTAYTKNNGGVIEEILNSFLHFCDRVSILGFNFLLSVLSSEVKIHKIDFFSFFHQKQKQGRWEQKFHLGNAQSQGNNLDFLGSSSDPSCNFCPVAAYLFHLSDMFCVYIYLCVHF